ncbi:MAG: chromosomal replication initiator protein DnaA [Elusimicrobia bacterium]|nr:chromosomal replication initiator protein DnaA [Elusimicrobiota bacterium]
MNVLRSHFPVETFKLWFSPTRASSFDNNTLVIEVPNKYFSDWMLRNKNHIDSAAQSIPGLNSPDIQFIIKPDINAYLPPKKDDIPDPTYQPEDESVFSSELNPRYTFDSFVVGSSNRFAQAASEAVANEPGTRYNPLFVYGGVGLGKTHLLHSIGHRIKMNDPKKRVLYVTCEKFTQEMIDSIINKDTINFNKKYTNLSVLLMDDIQFLENKERTQEVFFHIFNTLYESQKQLVITSDNPPSKIRTLEERLRSRFQWGVITDIQPPDLETRIAILKSKAEREHLDVPDDVLLFIAANIKDNIRKLEGALIRIYAFSSLTGSDVNVDNVKEILKDIITKDEESKPISIQNIQNIVAKHYHVQVKDMKSIKRHKNLVFPRHLAMYLSRKLTEHSTTEIGREFGDRDHATVMYASKIIRKKIEDDPYFETIVEKMINEIKSTV